MPVRARRRDEPLVAGHAAGGGQRRDPRDGVLDAAGAHGANRGRPHQLLAVPRLHLRLLRTSRSTATTGQVADRPLRDHARLRPRAASRHGGRPDPRRLRPGARGGPARRALVRRGRRPSCPAPSRTTCCRPRPRCPRSPCSTSRARRPSRRSAPRGSARATACRRRSASPTRSRTRSGLSEIDLPLTPAKLAGLVAGEEPAPPMGAGTRAKVGKPGDRTMSGSGEARVQAPPEAVWAMLLDADVLASLIPGSHGVQKLSDTHFQADVTLGVGPVKGRYKADVKLSDLDPPRGDDADRLWSPARSAAAAAAAASRLRRTAGRDDSHRYTYEAAVGGKVAAVGGRLLEGASRVIIGQFFAALARKGGGRHGRAGPDRAPARSYPLAPRDAPMKPARFDYVRAGLCRRDHGRLARARRRGPHHRRRPVAAADAQHAPRQARRAGRHHARQGARPRSVAEADAIVIPAGVRQAATLARPTLGERAAAAGRRAALGRPSPDPLARHDLRLGRPCRSERRDPALPRRARRRGPAADTAQAPVACRPRPFSPA